MSPVISHIFFGRKILQGAGVYQTEPTALPSLAKSVRIQWFVRAVIFENKIYVHLIICVAASQAQKKDPARDAGKLLLRFAGTASHAPEGKSTRESFLFFFQICSYD